MRLSGVNVNQVDMPWWYVDVLNWLALVDSFDHCPGTQAGAHRANLKHILSKGRPEEVYKAYKSMQLYREQVQLGTAK